MTTDAVLIVGQLVLGVLVVLVFRPLNRLEDRMGAVERATAQIQGYLSRSIPPMAQAGPGRRGWPRADAPDSEGLEP